MFIDMECFGKFNSTSEITNANQNFDESFNFEQVIDIMPTNAVEKI